MSEAGRVTKIFVVENSYELDFFINQQQVTESINTR